jgi:hypothetical protein
MVHPISPWVGCELARRAGWVLALCASRDTGSVTTLMQKVRACVLWRLLFSCASGRQAYIQAISFGLGETIGTCNAGRTHLWPWEGFPTAPAVKQYPSRWSTTLLRSVNIGELPFPSPGARATDAWRQPGGLHHDGYGATAAPITSEERVLLFLVSGGNDGPACGEWIIIDLWCRVKIDAGCSKGCGAGLGDNCGRPNGDDGHHAPLASGTG